MSNQPLNRSVNTGGRHDPNSKIYGGIYFEGNDQPTSIPTAGEYVRIGNGSVGHELYTSILPATYINPYWELTNTEDVTEQELKYIHGKNSTFTVHWGLSIIIVDAESDPANFGFRLRRRVSPGVAVNVTSGIKRGCACLSNFIFSWRFSTILQMEMNQSFFIDITNFTNSGDEVIVFDSEIVFTQ